MTTTLAILVATALAISFWLHGRRCARLRRRAGLEAAAQEWEQKAEELLRQFDDFRKEVARNRRDREALRKQSQQATSRQAASKAPKPRKSRLHPVASPPLAEENDWVVPCIDAYLAADPRTYSPVFPFPQAEPRAPRRSILSYAFRPWRFTLRCMCAALATVIHLCRGVANFFTRQKPPPPSSNALHHRHAA